MMNISKSLPTIYTIISNIRYTTILLVVVVFAGCNRDGPLLINTPATVTSIELDKAAPLLMKKNDVTGLSVVVIDNGKISISKSYGFSDYASKKRVDEHTVYRAASLGKPIFAYIVLSLARKGIITLDEPLFQYFNEEVVRGDPRSRIITARMVLTHTTGLPNLDGTKSEVGFLFDPGTDFQYSGHAYLYLQKVIEKITGKQINELASEHVFKPLKMKDSSFIWKDEYTRSISSSYNKTGDPFQPEQNPEVGYSAWSLFTTINDYAHFVSHLIDTSRDHNSVSSEMLKPYVNVTDNLEWGLGWGLQNTVPNYSFWHWGSMAGFRHYTVGYPKERKAVIVMSNSWKAFKMIDDIMTKAIGGSYPSYDWF
jgi:CubicO group peptidase (beta-lactamase class C family)